MRVQHTTSIILQCDQRAFGLLKGVKKDFGAYNALSGVRQPLAEKQLNIYPAAICVLYEREGGFCVCPGPGGSWPSDKMEMQSARPTNTLCANLFPSLASANGRRSEPARLSYSLLVKIIMPTSTAANYRHHHECAGRTRNCKQRQPLNKHTRPQHLHLSTS